MSEWGIPQGSTFGGLGGCFVEGLSMVGGLVICGLLINFSVKQGNNDLKTDVNSDKVKYEPQKVENHTDTIKFIGYRNSRDYLGSEYERMQRWDINALQYTR